MRPVIALNGSSKATILDDDTDTIIATFTIEMDEGNEILQREDQWRWHLELEQGGGGGGRLA